MPTESSTPEEVSAFYTKLGMPSPEEYNIEGADDALKEMFIKNNILPKQASALIEALSGMADSDEEDDSSDYEAEVQQNMEQLREEWGDSFDGNLQRAQQAFKTFGNDEMAEYLADTGLGDDPMLIKLFSNIGAKLGSEDTFRGQASPDVTRDSARARINSLYADTAGPLYDKSSPKHGDILKELEALSMVANS